MSFLDNDPFALAQQFDQMRGSLTQGLSPITPAPAVQTIPYGGTSLPGTAPFAASGNAPVLGNTDWGSKTANFQQQLPGLRWTSGYRDPDHNAAVGGVPNSYHLQQDAQGNARANDYVGSAADMQKGAALAKQMGAKEVLIHNAGSGQHLHIAW